MKLTTKCYKNFLTTKTTMFTTTAEELERSYFLEVVEKLFVPMTREVVLKKKYSQMVRECCLEIKTDSLGMGTIKTLGMVSQMGDLEDIVQLPWLLKVAQEHVDVIAINELDDEQNESDGASLTVEAITSNCYCCSGFI